MKIICFDYGEKRIGVSASDDSGTLAGGIKTLTVRGFTHAVEHAISEIRQQKASKIVIGLPKNMDGSESFSAEKVRKFGSALSEGTGLEVVYYDERMTTMQAHIYLNSTEFFGKKRKGVIDTLSAQIILQDYLDSEKNKK
ncbi:MAG: Holliday junction resolvase RuvX [Eubacteriales bacterium]|nr:Holliday junction resolvase RuvX [Eubacteriales bacterium]MDD4476064.1 Holliday junction resolvase RuvX [Eubacteriales bacterium]